MGVLGNFIWFIFGGFCMGIGWLLSGLIMYLSIIGIPWGRSCFVIGKFSFFPFGREAISRKKLSRKSDFGTGRLGLIGNIIWFLFFGWWLAMGHAISGVACCITIIGIPFGIQHFKLAGISLLPIGVTIVSKEEAQAARKANAEEKIKNLRKTVE